MGEQTFTVPTNIKSDIKNETDVGLTGEGQSQYEDAPDAPTLRGQARPYEEVFSSYEKSYRESLDRMQLPSRLENVVKQYFSEVDPKGAD